ncbi:CPBP family intramembrane glutamic endopeptidase [Arthrobacter bambusae]|uniref:Membrane protease YdiL (CAAX protease family) n=1 Tax=Arthrobacter bambusae TaxID=1338426 RepID=A0AAW8DGW6_9MICC|nr:type II CAAX endopeptidase family protein [Arthrobacter bambusae]MDP9904726.1 membrane protease YdiL (CAAX protease family) [Arthrobacter bambusae]MDQ0129542.1 membrane protease YdiL (CAAX protease family) [Arthrobacter bambusae]MDQ0180845.1 membrane protease YdiL (CAAX protease family) [Arthrobacter bambusae]
MPHGVRSQETGRGTALHRGLAGTIWCLLVPVAVLGGYLVLVLISSAWVTSTVLAGTIAGAVVVIVFGIVRVLRPAWLSFAPEVLPASVTPWFWPRIALTAVLMFLAGQAAGAWIYTHLGSTGFDRHVQAQQSSGFALSLLASLLVAPVVEEALFRGLLYPMLRKKAGAVVAAVLSSLLFAALHGNAVQAMAVIPLGLLLALVAERTRRVWPCMVLHLAYNLAAMMLPQAAVQVMSTPLCIGLFGVAWVILFVLLGRQVLSGGITEQTGEPRARDETE